jgi:hypothetical protein
VEGAGAASVPLWQNQPWRIQDSAQSRREEPVIWENGTIQELSRLGEDGIAFSINGNGQGAARPKLFDLCRRSADFPFVSPQCRFLSGTMTQL